jgi:hypothetical protein
MCTAIAFALPTRVRTLSDSMGYVFSLVCVMLCQPRYAAAAHNTGPDPDPEREREREHCVR